MSNWRTQLSCHLEWGVRLLIQMSLLFELLCVTQLALANRLERLLFDMAPIWDV